jgi:hypothetical protein
MGRSASGVAKKDEERGHQAQVRRYRWSTADDHSLVMPDLIRHPPFLWL